MVVLPEADVDWCGVNCGRLFGTADATATAAAAAAAAALLDADDLERELLREDVGDSMPPSRLGD